MAYIPNKADSTGRSNWQPGDKITATNLNHIEDGLARAAEEADKKELPIAGEVGQVLTKTATGAVWATKESTLYEGGFGIDITGTVINADTTVIATKSDLITKQDQLISGTNIKTINNISLLGAGDITIQGGLSQDLTVGYSVGGIAAGTTYLAGTTFEQILRDMLIYIAPPVYDIYFGSVADVVSRDFKVIEDSTLIANASPYDLASTPIIWNPSTTTEVFYMLIKADNLAIVKDGTLVSEGLTTTYTAEDITSSESTSWKGNAHMNVTINGIEYKVCGLCGTDFNTSDTVTINFNK